MLLIATPGGCRLARYLLTSFRTTSSGRCAMDLSRWKGSAMDPLLEFDDAAGGDQPALRGYAAGRTTRHLRTELLARDRRGGERGRLRHPVRPAGSRAQGRGDLRHRRHRHLEGREAAPGGRGRPTRPARGISASARSSAPCSSRSRSTPTRSRQCSRTACCASSCRSGRS